MKGASDRFRCHDPQRALRRWQKIAKKAKLTFHELGRVDGEHQVVAIRSAEISDHSLYLSAGVHGDEPAAVEALAEWGEASIDFLKSASICILPCLNPWGLEQNSRRNARGQDLNRSFHRNIKPLGQLKRFLRGMRFELALCLHEDYDATGLYLYELPGCRPYIGERILQAAKQVVPLESRVSVEGIKCRKGLIRRSAPPEIYSQQPESLYLALFHARRSLTVETPSEFSLDTRVAAHMRVLEAVACWFREYYL